MIKQKPSRDDAQLKDMLKSAKLAAGYVEGRTFEQFWHDAKTRDAVAMRLTVIGEAAGKVSAETRAKIPGVPFHQISGLRNRIAHSYESVDFREVWKITEKDLKPLVSELEKYFRQQLSLTQKISQSLGIKIDSPKQGHGPRMSM